MTLHKTRAQSQKAQPQRPAAKQVKSKADTAEVFFQRLGHKIYAFTIKNGEVYWVALTCPEPGVVPVSVL